jgi:ABC-type amino acid transport substrate-binding protein
MDKHPHSHLSMLQRFGRSITRMMAWLAIWLVSSPLMAAPMVVVHNGPEASGDTRQDYYWQLLRAALDITRPQYGDYVLRAHPELLPHQRAVAAVQSGQGPINIICRGLNDDLAARLLPVMLPLDKGLLGTRLMLVTEATQRKLDQLADVQGLKRFSVGQSATWADAQVLRQAGFSLVLTDNYESLFRMLDAGRFDLLPRGLVEIEGEFAHYRHNLPGLRIESRFMLQYPLSRYFMVGRSAEGERMAARIRDGLHALQRSGEFDRRYAAFKREVLKGLSLKGRMVMHLPNPLLQSDVPFDDPHWWDKLGAELGQP